MRFCEFFHSRCKRVILKIKTVYSTHILKIYPSKILLELKQTNFLAQTIVNNRLYLIGANEKFIEPNILWKKLEVLDKDIDNYNLENTLYQLSELIKEWQKSDIYQQ